MSEEMKNLNNEPEQAPVENKPEAKLPLSKQQIGIIAGIAAAVVVLIVVLALVLGGGSTPAGPDNGGDVNPPAGDVVTEEEYKLGLGVVVSLESSKTGTAQIDATVATVVLDKDGKIVACRIDAVQNKFAADFDEDTFNYTNLNTKMELGTAYGMAGNPYSSDNDGDGRILEWNEQAKAFETWCVGKTLAQVEAAGKEENLQNAHNHWFTTDEDLLAAGCTIQIGDFVNAVVKAGNDAAKVSFQSEGNFTLGLGVDSYDDGSVDADTADGTVKVYSDMAAVVVEGGKIVAALNDAIQPKISFDVAGEITAKTFNGTKRELKEGYGMEGNAWSSDNDGDGRILEWYKQSAAFSAHVAGKTVAQVEALGAEENLQNAHNHWFTKDEALLSAGCTIQIGAIVDVVVEAAANAR